MKIGPAEESNEIKRFRMTLENKVEKEKKQVNPEALGEAKKTMQTWLQRHEHERVEVTSINFKAKPFNENQNPAPESGTVQHRMKELGQSPAGIADLATRITKKA